MKNILENIQLYLGKALNVRVKIRPWKKGGDLPIFLVDTYDFYEISLFKQSFLLMISKDDMETTTPGTVKKHSDQIKKMCVGQSIIFVQKTISTYNRKRLIELYIPFIIPDVQMYLPDLGIDLREHFRKIRVHKKSFRPVTQTVIIHALLCGTDVRFIPSELAKKLGVSQMSLSRSFDELESAAIGEFQKKGKERWWLFNGNKRELWEQSKPYLRNPVKKRTWIKAKKNKYMCRIKRPFTLLNDKSTSHRSVCH